MSVEKMVTYAEFQSNPELQEKFQGSYDSYLNSFAAKLSGTAVFNFAAQNGESSIPGLNNVSLFFGTPKTKQTNSSKEIQAQNDKKQAEIEKKLASIKDSKIRAQIADELYFGNLSSAFFDLLMERYENKKNEFEEIWEKYQFAKGQAADMKKTCERLLREYQRNENSIRKSQYITAENNYKDADMWADIYLSSAMDASHRAV